MTLQSLNPIYVNFGVPQQSRSLRYRSAVRFASPPTTPAGLAWTGRVSAIDSKVDEATRNIQIQATLANPDGRLRPGCSFRPRWPSASQALIALPASAVSYAPFGDSVFVVAELKGPDGSVYRGVRQQFVKLGASRGDLISVLSGVKAGDEVVTSGVFKLRNGAAVLVNNKVQPGQQPVAETGEQLMKFTDLFVKRPVLAIVVNLVILIAGHAVDPRAERAASIRAATSPSST